MNTPYYLIDEAALRRNLEILRGVRERTGCKILLAQKAFSMFAVYPIIAEYLDGATASGLFEARLAAEELQGENHVFSAAYRAGEIPMRWRRRWTPSRHASASFSPDCAG